MAMFIQDPHPIRDAGLGINNQFLESSKPKGQLVIRSVVFATWQHCSARKFEFSGRFYVIVILPIITVCVYVTPGLYLVCNQPPRSTQPRHPFVGGHNRA